MDNPRFSTIDVLDLPEEEREVFLYLSREGPADEKSLAKSLNRNIKEIQNIISSLENKDWIKEGETFNSILENFPSISKEDIQEIIRYAQDIIAGERIIYESHESSVSH